MRSRPEQWCEAGRGPPSVRARRAGLLQARLLDPDGHHILILPSTSCSDRDRARRLKGVSQGLATRGLGTKGGPPAGVRDDRVVRRRTLPSRKAGLTSVHKIRKWKAGADRRRLPEWDEQFLPEGQGRRSLPPVCAIDGRKSVATTADLLEATHARGRAEIRRAEPPSRADVDTTTESQSAR